MLISYKEVVRQVAKRSKLPQTEVKVVLDELGEFIIASSKNVTEDDPLTIKIMSGMHYMCSLKKDHIVRCPYNNTYSQARDELIPKVRFHPAFKDYINGRKGKTIFRHGSLEYQKMMKDLWEAGVIVGFKKESTKKGEKEND